MPQAAEIQPRCHAYSSPAARNGNLPPSAPVQYYAEFEKDFMGLRDLKMTKDFHPSLQTFDQWLERNAGKIPTE